MTKLELATNYAIGLAVNRIEYIWGGDDPLLGYDCSGLVQEILASVGLDPVGDQSAQALLKFFPKSEPQQGALVFYGPSVNKITHVAFMIDDKHIVEAAGGGPTTRTKEDAAEQNAYVRIRPYNKRKDIVAVLMPQYT